MEEDFNLQSGCETASYRFTHEGVFLFENNFLPKFPMTWFLLFCALCLPPPLTRCQTPFQIRITYHCIQCALAVGLIVHTRISDSSFDTFLFFSVVFLFSLQARRNFLKSISCEYVRVFPLGQTREAESPRERRLIFQCHWILTKCLPTSWANLFHTSRGACVAPPSPQLLQPIVQAGTQWPLVGIIWFGCSWVRPFYSLSEC